MATIGLIVFLFWFLLSGWLYPLVKFVREEKYIHGVRRLAWSFLILLCSWIGFYLYSTSK